MFREKYLSQKNYKKAVGRYRHLAFIGTHPQSQFSMLAMPFVKCLICESVAPALWHVCFSVTNANTDTCVTK